MILVIHEEPQRVLGEVAHVGTEVMFESVKEVSGDDSGATSIAMAI
jgi:hypothetical protein